MSINKIYNLAKNQLFPICRSITGNGVKKTLLIIKSYIPELKIRNFSSGTKVYDWRIPNEWNVKDAYVVDKSNRKIIDFKKNNLHLMGYSRPVSTMVTKKELFNHLYSLPKQKNAVPYVTSYYKKNWGFCVSEKQKIYFKKKYKNSDKFFINIDSKFKINGKLTYGELIIPGASKKEILLSTYICHPSMANNELSGPMVSMALIKYFQKKKIKKTIRFIFIPETIGSISYIKKNFIKLKKYTFSGLNLTCLGDNRNYSYIPTKYKNTISDFAIIRAFKKLNINYKIYSFLDRGSDERQFNSPGVDLPIATICRTKFGTYPEYHTSLDNFNIVKKKNIFDSYNFAKLVVKNLLNSIIPINKIYCEPFLSKRNIYSTISIKKNRNLQAKKILDFLQYADGKNDLVAISEYINLSLAEVKKIYKIVLKYKLVNNIF